MYCSTQTHTKRKKRKRKTAGTTVARERRTLSRLHATRAKRTANRISVPSLHPHTCGEQSHLLHRELLAYTVARPRGEGRVGVGVPRALLLINKTLGVEGLWVREVPA